MSDRRKSKRRSSLAANRIQIQFGKLKPGAELHKLIGNEETSEERLAVLHKLCLEYTLQKMEEKNQNMDDFQEFRRTMLDQGLRKISEMQEDGSFKTAVGQDRVLVEHPYNIEMDEKIERLETYNKSLQNEVEQWELIMQESADNEDMKNMDPDTGPVITREEVSRNPDVASQYMMEQIDTYNILKEVEMEVHQALNVMNKCGRTFSLLKKVTDVSNEIVNQKSDQIKAESFKNYTSCTPRSIIQKISSMETPKANNFKHC